MYDFYSDTKTKPSKAMREVVLDAVVGDEQKGEDPTTTALCERVADLLGKEDAVFLPSGTMCNEIAIMAHIRPGDEVICERSCHIVNFEGGAPAAFSGAMIHALDGERGMFTGHQVSAALRPQSRYAPQSRLMCVEQTANMAGGSIWPLEQLDAVSGVAKGFDSCWIDFSKGLGAPVGAVLAGSGDFIDRAWIIKQQMGGAMRQSGVLAAMCLHVLDHNIERLADDHALAASIAEHLHGLSKVVNILPVETNIIIFDLSDDAPTARELVHFCEKDNIAIGAFGDRRIRIVTHLDVDQAAGDALCASFSGHLG